ncbi:MAG TPA: ribonuclease HII [Clostridiaceae bacterium]|nr:ribonuclease HII [Clostridiaceae bacterium]
MTDDDKTIKSVDHAGSSYKMRINDSDRERWQEMQSYTDELVSQGYQAIAGVDEAGRGPLAGPVVAAACILPPDREFPGLNDSKKMTLKRRETLYQNIIESAIAYSIIPVSAEIIDLINIRNATLQGMAAAVRNLKHEPDLVLTDAMALQGFTIPVQAIVKGDSKVNCIAAASVLAKVSRDRLMGEYDISFPNYGFAQHKGYGTKAHYQALEALGPCPIHRQSFLKTKLGEACNARAGELGEKCEREVAHHLAKQGFAIIGHRFKIHNVGEIDLVCLRDDMVYFVEVKARSDSSNYGGLAATITAEKIRHIRATAAIFLRDNKMSDKTAVLLAALVSLNNNQEVEHIKYLPIY